jgi:hypothetical protein
MSDTPETDLAIKAGGGDWSPVLRVTSQRLERQRNEAREKLENEMKWHHQTHKELVEAQRKLLDIEYDKLKG